MFTVQFNSKIGNWNHKKLKTILFPPPIKKTKILKQVWILPNVPPTLN